VLELAVAVGSSAPPGSRALPRKAHYHVGSFQLMIVPVRAILEI